MKFFILLTMVLLINVTGCYYGRDKLKRTPALQEQQPPAQSSRKKRNPDSGEDPLFNAVFNRKPQKFDDGTGLTPREKKLFRENDVRNDPAVKSLHRKNRKNETKNSDWVFGTKNGSYF